MTDTAKYTIHCIVGARPNFVKMAALWAEFTRHPELAPVLVHTGQHYDERMSDVFFEQLGLPEPNHFLGVGGGSHHFQTGGIIQRYGEVVEKHRPDLVVVVGDVNSTAACGLVAAKECISLAHVEAGLRSGDRSMPEEINRIVTDALSDLLFTTEASGEVNLRREGAAPEKIHFVGNVMIDTLVRFLDMARRSDVPKKMGVESRRFALLTLHRPSNVSDYEQLSRTVAALAELGRELPVIFPVHPRTRQQLGVNHAGMNMWDGSTPIGTNGLWATDPLGYLDFLALTEKSAVVITDSGGIQEETTYLGVPCVTLRANTERPVTISHGTNHLVGTDARAAVVSAADILSQPPRKRPEPPPLWDGHAAERIVRVILDFLDRA